MDIKAIKFLLDVNVLIALLDKAHEHHQIANAWVNQNIREGRVWVSCPITQNGCVRIMSYKKYEPIPFPIGKIIDELNHITSTSEHVFIPDDISLLNSILIDRDKLSNSKQVTDVYLLALAKCNDCQFVTFNRKIAIHIIKDISQDFLEILSA